MALKLTTVRLNYHLISNTAYVYMGIESRIPTENCTPIFLAVLFTIAKKVEATQLPIIRKTGKQK